MSLLSGGDDMVGVLSIDFDYFIDVTAKERAIYFPKGNDEVPKEMLEEMWKERYLKYPALKEAGLIEEYYKMKGFLRLLHVDKEKFICSDTHKDIARIINRIPCSLKVKLVNVDFHHDYYNFYTGGNRLNCGNWLRRVIEMRRNTEVIWIRRADSQTCSLEGEFPFKHTTDLELIFRERYDYVFLCRSPEWSPPHLSKYFEELAFAVTSKTA
jgi:hypothetical protein